MKSFSLMLLLSMFFGAEVSAQKNLVANGNFEDELYGWNAGTAKTTPWIKQEGKASCVISSPDKDNWVGMDQTIDLPKKAAFLEVSAWMKTDNVVQGKDSWNTALFMLEFLDKADKRVGEDINVGRQTGDQSWQQFTKAVTIPAGAVRFKLMAALGNASGTMFIDDVKAKIITQEAFAQQNKPVN